MLQKCAEHPAKKCPKKMAPGSPKLFQKYYQNVRKSGTTMVVKCAQKWGTKNDIKMCCKSGSKTKQKYHKIKYYFGLLWWLWPKIRQIVRGSN